MEKKENRRWNHLDVSIHSNKFYLCIDSLHGAVPFEWDSHMKSRIKFDLIDFNVIYADVMVTMMP